MLARIQNVLVSALNGSKHGIFPKYIVVVLDDDIISFLDCKTSDGVATLYMQGLSIPFACIGSGDPVRVLRLYTMNTLDIL